MGVKGRGRRRRIGEPKGRWDAMGEEGGGEDAIVGGEMGMEVGMGDGVAKEHPFPLPLQYLFHFFSFPLMLLFFFFFFLLLCFLRCVVFLPSSPTAQQNHHHHNSKFQNHHPRAPPSYLPISQLLWRWLCLCRRLLLSLINNSNNNININNKIRASF